MSVESPADHPAASGEEQQREKTSEEEGELPLVLLLSPLTPEFRDALAAKFRFLEPWESPLPRDQFLTAHAGSVRALVCFALTPVTADILDRLPRIELVVASSAGVSHIDLAECRRRGVAVTNAGDAFTEDVADYAVGLLIDVLRRVSAADRFVRRGLWPSQLNYPLGSKLGGKRIGIVGLGSIGSAVAKRLEAFGCIISYHSRRKKPSFSYDYFSNVRDLAANSNVLVVSIALTPETHHIVNKEVMLALGKDGIVINIGRGALVDEEELVRCLMKGEIAGAGLDVFENEPTVPQELFLMDNVILSPHAAMCTPESLISIFEVITANLEAFFLNKPLVSPISY